MLTLCRWPFTKAAVEQMAWEMLPGGLRNHTCHCQPFSGPWTRLAAVAKAVLAAATTQLLRTNSCLFPRSCRRHLGAE